MPRAIRWLPSSADLRERHGPPLGRIRLLLVRREAPAPHRPGKCRHTPRLLGVDRTFRVPKVVLAGGERAEERSHGDEWWASGKPGFLWPLYIEQDPAQVVHKGPHQIELACGSRGETESGNAQLARGHDDRDLAPMGREAAGSDRRAEIVLRLRFFDALRDRADQ